MSGVLEALYRHPVKGFTPETLEQIALRVGEGVPFDRAFAVEDGPSGFDPQAPAHISKMRFTVLAKLPMLARVRTRYDDASATLHAEAPGQAPLAVSLNEEAGREAFAAWLAAYLGDEARGPLRVIPAPGAHRFYDDPQGPLSLVNLESVRDLERNLGRAIDPLRFRANLYVSGWPPWCELEAQNARVTIGAAAARIHGPIRRCTATYVDPSTGACDIDMLEALRDFQGHTHCGVYLQVEQDGLVRIGDAAELVQ